MENSVIIKELLDRMEKNFSEKDAALREYLVNGLASNEKLISTSIATFKMETISEINNRKITDERIIRSIDKIEVRLRNIEKMQSESNAKQCCFDEQFTDHVLKQNMDQEKYTEKDKWTNRKIYAVGIMIIGTLATIILKYANIIP